MLFQFRGSFWLPVLMSEHLNNLGGYLTDGTSYRVRPIRFPA